jgi:hypothetical protein
VRRFTDSTGRPWRLRLDVDAMDRIRTLAGIDLLDSSRPRLRRPCVTPPTSPPFSSPLSSPTRSPARCRGRVPDAMGPAACEQAVPIFAAEFSDFFPPPRGQPTKTEPPKSFDAWQCLRRMAGVAGVPAGPHTLESWSIWPEAANAASGGRRRECCRCCTTPTSWRRNGRGLLPVQGRRPAIAALKISMLMLKPLFVPAPLLLRCPPNEDVHRHHRPHVGDRRPDQRRQARAAVDRR